MTCAQFSADQVFIPLIKVIRFENLHVTDIMTLNFSLVNGSASTKSSVSVKEKIGGDSIGCSNP